MDLFQRQTIERKEDLPPMFITVVDPDGSELPVQNWCRVEQVKSFRDLVSPAMEEILIIAVPDTSFALQQVKLVVENAALVGVAVTRVAGVVPYAPSSIADTSFWMCPVVDFAEWQLEADEASRISELARRAELDRDERRMEANARSDGTFKEVKVPATEVDGEETPDAPVF